MLCTRPECQTETGCRCRTTYVRIDDVKTITDRLIARNGKFKAFFSRPELESHVAFVMAPHYEMQAGSDAMPVRGELVRGELALPHTDGDKTEV